jgi:hypothetical protein
MILYKYIIAGKLKELNCCLKQKDEDMKCKIRYSLLKSLTTKNPKLKRLYQKLEWRISLLDKRIKA